MGFPNFKKQLVVANDEKEELLISIGPSAVVTGQQARPPEALKCEALPKPIDQSPSLSISPTGSSKGTQLFEDLEIQKFETKE
ncbi:hypothetical protein K3495_g5651 [Podosphaera aphanis]|nr:hypothetical protein K3495_g5651 [Podosphaera aphanis]